MKSLEALISFDFEMEVYATSNPSALRRMLQKSDYIANFRRDFEEGRISPKTVESFVEMLLREHFQEGIAFPFRNALAAIAVAFEESDQEFAKEYLTELGRVYVGEFSMASHVARLILEKQ